MSAPGSFPLLVASLALAAGLGAQQQGERPGLEAGIERAIERATGYVLQAQQRDGSWGDHQVGFPGGQTALSLFALLRAGVPHEHPAIQRGVTRLLMTEPEMTYSVGFQLLALEAYQALGGEVPRGRIEELTERLLEWQVGGTFGYPNERNPDRASRGPRRDLSNTQIAALGLRAAAKAGVRIDADVWKDLMKGTLHHQEEPWTKEEAPEEGRSSTGGRELAGFAYRVALSSPMGRRMADIETRVTGSMTAAGVAILEICREQLGRKLSQKDGVKLELAKQRGLAWLADYFDEHENPRVELSPEYYLYGVERVGGLLGLTQLDEHDWYLEGARMLLRRQAANGGFLHRAPESATCFALLFLTRATLPITGVTERKREPLQAFGEVHLVVTGEDPATVFVAGFSKEVLATHGELEITEVEYLVDGQVRATLAPGDVTDERYPTRLGFGRPGAYGISARVRAHPTTGAEPRPSLVLSSEEAELVVSYAEAQWMDAAAAAVNLLEEDGTQVTASSSAPSDGPELAIDGHEGTAWIAAPDDVTPTLTIVLDRTVKARKLSIGPADTRGLDRGIHDRIVRALVTIDREEPVEVVFDEDVRRPAILEFERTQAVRRIEIRLVERVPGSGRRSTVGLSEVQLLGDG